ncbi:3-hydroxybutyryl-CoA dehydratase [[Clostridium] ultunense Esp]|uniref:3-hydroxybutyryl-CoA dehydratase n=1 Tax=[Clostridium] ultunense Esp TaxID=1288971 RepID=M1ZG15_9FIRM|nr:short-chain-enoyl-CoA hydratase [Schnuerera ultunensis]CCQ97349.1 3-hydroxybutyryl-CoA dehydratase [[Clostridium] ultunense Esp]SHD78410.1 3-hydroxybutyryl-CoA dehydratase [[Clostridium] ultunense Esp]
MDFNDVLFKKDRNIGIISINRPNALNALNSNVLGELDNTVDMVIDDDDVHILIITGEGRAFVAGADISEMKDMNMVAARKFAEKGSKLFRKIELMEKPVIAAVNGFALGGGCELAMCCDLRIASTKAKFGQPEVGLGIIPGFAGTQRLSRIIGLGKAKELIFTTEMIDAEEAYRIGLVNKIVPGEELMDEAIAMANKIVSNGQIAVRFAKVAINRGIETDIETGMDIEKNLFGLCFATEDQKEGMEAFLEKRKPNYKLK